MAGSWHECVVAVVRLLGSGRVVFEQGEDGGVGADVVSTTIGRINGYMNM